MKIAFNASQLIGPLTGVGQYSLQLATALQALDDVELRLFYLNHWSRDITPRDGAALQSLKALVKRWVPRPYELTRALQQRAFDRGMEADRVDLYHEPSFLPFRFDGPCVVTIHDLSWVRYPQTHPAERVRILDKLMPRAVESAAHLIVDSRFIRDEVMAHYGVPPGRVSAIPIAARGTFSPRLADRRTATLQSLGLTDRAYFLCVGTLEPRKNLQLAMLAHARLPADLRSRCPLVLCGGRGWHNDELDAMMRGPLSRNELRLTGFVDDERLADLYSGAIALLYPSRYEGFGLPPLEAMACATPVILSDSSSLPEVGGAAATYHSPDDDRALAAAMQRMAEDAAFRDERATAALAQSRRFCWQQTAMLTRDVYRTVLPTS